MTLVKKIGVLAVAVVTVLSVEIAAAQRRPDPPPAKKPDVGPRRSVVPEEFLAAYRRAQSPRLLIYVYKIFLEETREGELNQVGELDTFAERLRTQFAHPAITQISPYAVEIRNKVEFESLARNDQDGAARLLINEVDTEILIFFHLTELHGRADGARYAASYVIIDKRRGHRIGQHSWVMSPDESDGSLSMRRQEKYAKAIAKRIQGDFMIEYPEGAEPTARKFTLRVIGVPANALKKLRDAIRTLDGVAEVLRADFDRSAGSRLATFDLRYRGEPLDLAQDAADAGAETLKMDVFFTMSREGLITLEARPKPLTSVESLLNGDDPTPANAEELRRMRTRFVEAYQASGSPTIAVMINKEAVRDADDPSSGAAGVAPAPTSAPAGSGTEELAAVTRSAGPVQIVKVYARPEDDREADANKDAEAVAEVKKDSELTDEELLNRRDMENRLLTRLAKLGVRLVDLEQAWRILAQERKFQEQVWSDVALSRLLGEKAGADIVLSGCGRVLRRNNNAEVRYTFRAYSVQNAQVLAAASVNHTLEGGAVRFLDAVTDALAADAAGKLAYQMMESWEPPDWIEVRISNVSSLREVQAVSDLLREKLPKLISHASVRGFQAGPEGGVGYLQVRYDGEFEDLIRTISRQEELPFDLDNVSSNREVLNLRITGKLP